MTKKVFFNGIEISQSRYDQTTLSIFDYLDMIKSRFERGLSKEDEIAKFSVDIDFSSYRSPKHRINANSSTTKKTEEKIAHILNIKANNAYSHVVGSVKVNFLVEDRK